MQYTNRKVVSEVLIRLKVRVAMFVINNLGGNTSCVPHIITIGQIQITFLLQLDGKFEFWIPGTRISNVSDSFAMRSETR